MTHCADSNSDKEHRMHERASAKPLLRGWLHGVATIGAMATTVVMLAQSGGDIRRTLSLAIFGVSMVMLFLGSAIYHLGSWSSRQDRLIRAFDHANIFVFIAGAYTPFCVIVLTGWGQIAMVGAIWGLAALGVVIAVSAPQLPRWWRIALYLGMGWLSLILLPHIAQAISLAPVLLLIASGALYTIGAVIYALRWPNPIPWLFGHHELFHLLVVCGVATTTVTIWVWVIPFSRS
jgi:hemolysin III